MHQREVESNEVCKIGSRNRTSDGDDEAKTEEGDCELVHGRTGIKSSKSVESAKLFLKDKLLISANTRRPFRLSPDRNQQSRFYSLGKCNGSVGCHHQIQMKGNGCRSAHLSRNLTHQRVLIGLCKRQMRAQ